MDLDAVQDDYPPGVAFARAVAPGPGAALAFAEAVPAVAAAPSAALAVAEPVTAVAEAAPAAANSGQHPTPFQIKHMQLDKFGDGLGCSKCIQKPCTASTVILCSSECNI